MELKCSMRTCSSPVTSHSGRVEVRAFNTTPDQQATLQARWTDNADALFHPDCWSQMCQNVDTKSSQAELKLSELEISLIKEARKTAEHHAPCHVLKTETKRIALMLRNSDYPVFFTGAGISTAAGIGDFRGKDGKWTERDKVKKHGAKGKTKSYARKPLNQLRPTYTHEAIQKLVEMGVFKFVISQNTDGLHRLSGVPSSKLAELHGNSFVQKCEKCQRRYDFSKRQTSNRAVPPKKCKQCHINHRTGRMCERKECGGYLMNTIINFGDYLEEPVLESAREHAERADLFACLGSTLAVSPANSLVVSGRKPNRLVICNRQATDFDEQCLEVDSKGFPIGSRIYGDCDKFMTELMHEILGEEVAKEWEEGRDARMEEYDHRRE